MDNLRHTGFQHEILEAPSLTVVYTAMSRKTFPFRVQVSRYVFDRGCCPANPYMAFDFDFYSLVTKRQLLSANNSLLTKADELWAFGPVSDGVLAEMLLFARSGKPLRFFRFSQDSDSRFEEIQSSEPVYEDDVAHLRDDIISLLGKHSSDRAGDRACGHPGTVEGDMATLVK